MLRNGTLLHHGCEGTLLRILAMGLQTLIGAGGEGGVTPTGYATPQLGDIFLPLQGTLGRGFCVV